MTDETLALENPTDEQRSRNSLLLWAGVWVGVIALLSLLFIGLSRAQEGTISIGSPAPEISLTSFDGQVVSPADLTGKIVVINFWASWCKPCEQEAAELQTAWEIFEARGDVIFLGATYADTEPEALQYMQRFAITYPNGPDLGTRLHQSFGATGVPETYFIDKNGVLAYAQIGPFQSLQQITSVVDNLLAQQP
jgi:cytochrome c biogenesis protein CcmG/thiol:disulfide interchange protein DsbE